MMITSALIVDDSPMILKIIKKALLTNKIDGYHFHEDSIYCASDGMEAFETMGRGYDIKLIISDINMPYLNGDEFIEILRDTDKLENLDVVFVTSSSTKFMLKNEVRDSILGVIYKPFSFESFVAEFIGLQKQKALQSVEIQEIKKEQIQKKSFIKDVCFLYLKEMGLKPFLMSLDVIIDEAFCNAQITKDEYAELIYSVLGIYLFEVEVEHKVSHKRVKCILKHKENTSHIKKNTLRILENFQRELVYVNSTDLRPSEIVKALVSNTFDTLSMATSNVRKFPKVDNKLYYLNFDFIIKEFIKIDCEFEDEMLLRLMSEYKEIEEFSKFLYTFLYNKEVFKSVKAASISKALGVELTSRLSKILKITYTLAKHYCANIEFYIFYRAKNCNDIHRFFKKNMPKSIPSSSTFLHYKGRVTTQGLREYRPYEIQKVAVISTELSILEFFKGSFSESFKNWSFFCFAKNSILEAWLGSNKPNKIVIDYNFKGSIFNNGVEFLKLLYKKQPELKHESVVNGVYFIVDENTKEEIKKYKDLLSFGKILHPIEANNAFESLIYE